MTVLCHSLDYVHNDFRTTQHVTAHACVPCPSVGRLMLRSYAIYIHIKVFCVLVMLSFASKGFLT